LDFGLYSFFQCFDFRKITCRLKIQILWAIFITIDNAVIILTFWKMCETLSIMKSQAN
jgi:hypothetical protein